MVQGTQVPLSSAIAEAVSSNMAELQALRTAEVTYDE